MHGMVKTFSDEEKYLIDFDVRKQRSRTSQCPLLLLADCSPNPVLAVYVQEMISPPVSALIVHAAGKYIKIVPELFNKTGSVIIDSVTNKCYHIKEGLDMAYPHDDPNEDPQFR